MIEEVPFTATWKQAGSRVSVYITRRPGGSKIGHLSMEEGLWEEMRWVFNQSGKFVVVRQEAKVPETREVRHR